MPGLAANLIARPYREVSVQEVGFPLDPESITAHLLGRPVYRRTAFLVLVHGADRALVAVEKDSTEPLFTPVNRVQILAGPDEVAFVEDPSVDTGNATQMARAALRSGQAGRVYVIQGMFQHVNFIVEPAPLRIRVVEVIPPEPPKLLEMARRVLEFDEDLPPIELEFVPIDLRRLAAAAPADRYLFPCRCAGLDLEVPVDFLDACPPLEKDWTMVGCERSRQIHEAFYGHDPAGRVDLCPRQLDPPGDVPTLLKCCLLERGIETSGARLVVPWGANLDEVRRALAELAAPPEPAGPVEPAVRSEATQRR